MFAVYNNGSVGFRSTADNLYNLKILMKLVKQDLKPDEGFIQEMNKRNLIKEKIWFQKALIHIKWQILIL